MRFVLFERMFVMEKVIINGFIEIVQINGEIELVLLEIKLLFFGLQFISQVNDLLDLLGGNDIIFVILIVFISKLFFVGGEFFDLLGDINFIGVLVVVFVFVLVLQIFQFFFLLDGFLLQFFFNDIVVGIFFIIVYSKNGLKIEFIFEWLNINFSVIVIMIQVFNSIELDMMDFVF